MGVRSRHPRKHGRVDDPQPRHAPDPALRVDHAVVRSLGTHACGKSCLYIKRLSDVHLPTLKKIVNASVKHMIKTHPPDARPS